MAASNVWKLKRYGRFVPGSGKAAKKPWKLFDAVANKPQILLTFLEPGYLLVSQGNESLDMISLLCGSDFVKVQQNSDNLMIRVTMEGESRMMRMQFDGRKRAEAVKECSSAAEKLKEYVTVTTQNGPTPPNNQPPAEVSAPVPQGKAVRAEPELVQGSLSIKRLTQHFLGEAALNLPQVYHHSPLAENELKPILRVCLLDPNFHALVEKVESELKKLLQE